MQELVIESGRVGRQYWKDLWRYRELFYFLAWRNYLVRYKQTVVGITWSLIRPLLTMAVLTIVFGRIAKMPSGGSPYPILVFCGILPWQFFASALGESGGSLIGNTNLITKIYFPRMIIPAASLITSLVDFMISGFFLAILMIWYGHPPGPQVLLLPFFLIIAFGAAFGAGLWVSALMVKYRDFKYIVPFVVQFGLYISPVGFSSTAVPEQWRFFYSLNPMVAVIDGFRWAILGGEYTIYAPGLLAAVVVVAALIATGFRYFRSTERTFADVI